MDKADQRDFDSHYEYWDRLITVLPGNQEPGKIGREMRKQCPHDKTVALNEDGCAGVFCLECGERIEDGC